MSFRLRGEHLLLGLPRSGRTLYKQHCRSGQGLSLPTHTDPEVAESGRQVPVERTLTPVTLGPYMTLPEAKTGTEGRRYWERETPSNGQR